MGPIRYNEPPPRPDAETKRTAVFARKQKWKDLHGNRYTPDELREMSASLGTLIITEQETPVMHLK